MEKKEEPKISNADLQKMNVWPLLIFAIPFILLALLFGFIALLVIFR